PLTIMDFDLSKPQRLLKDSARELLARQCKPARVRELMETATADDDQLWREIADQGWTGLIIPEEHGGLGLGMVEMAVVSEEIGRACLPGAFLSTLFSAALIDRAGSPQQKAKYLEAIAAGGLKGSVAAGELKATVAQLEENANWDLDAVNVKAERKHDEYQVSGRKLFVPDAAVAD